MTEKKTPPVAVKPDASHLPHECPRLLDHRGFLICHRSLIQVIHNFVILASIQLFSSHLMLFVRFNACIFIFYS